MASAFTFRGAGVPLLLFSDERDAYLDTLEAADRGSGAVFVRLLFDAVLSGIAVVTDELKAGQAPVPSTVMGSLRSLLTAQGGLLHPQIDVVASKLVDQFLSELGDMVRQEEFLEGVSATSSSMGMATKTSHEGFRRMLSPKVVLLSVNSEAPASGNRKVTFEIFIARDPLELEAFWLSAAEANLQSRFTLREVYPQISTGARLRLRALAKQALGEQLALVASDAEGTFGVSGYGPIESG